MSQVDSKLLKKYNVPGPRYTSYPTVPYWETNPTEAQWVDSVRLALDEFKGGAALYIHIPFCESLCTYCGCNTRITRNHAVANPYIDTVIAEWKLYLSRLDRDIALSEIHLGGGTPTFLSSAELQKLMGGILGQPRVSRAAEFEFSVEADPRVTTRLHLETLREAGFTRLSLGIQDFDPKVQEVVHRIQSIAQVRELTEAARKLGYTSINYDLIYGLPFQTEQSILYMDTFTTNSVVSPNGNMVYPIDVVIKSKRKMLAGDSLLLITDSSANNGIVMNVIVTSFIKQ
jgi:oxygen-independent coproporphyrinogen-3 oxidase